VRTAHSSSGRSKPDCTWAETRHFHVGVTVPGRTTRATTQTFWNETAVDLTGKVWATQNANDMVFAGISDTAQRASVLLNYTR